MRACPFRNFRFPADGFRKSHAVIYLLVPPSAESTMTRIELAGALVAGGAALLSTDAPLGWAMLWAGVALGMGALAAPDEE